MTFGFPTIVDGPVATPVAFTQEVEVTAAASEIVTSLFQSVSFFLLPMASDLRASKQPTSTRLIPVDYLNRGRHPSHFLREFKSGHTEATDSSLRKGLADDGVEIASDGFAEADHNFDIAG